MQNGITLVALVITIVILIILATVSIGAIFGENGLINRAQEAKNYQSNAEAEENQLFKDAETAINEALGGSGGSSSGEKTLVEMYDSGELKIGDYVDYKNPATGTYTAKGTDTGMDEAGTEIGISDQVFDVSKNQLNWRVLGKDEATGGIKLIAGSPMKSDNTVEGQQVPYLLMYGAKSYVNGENILNSIGALYKNEHAISARSVNMDDINAITGITTEDDIKRVNLDAYNGGKQYGETYSFEEHYTPESWLNGKQKTTVSGTVNGYVYAINSTQPEMPGVKLDDDRIYQMLFHNVEYQSGKKYWLASRGVIADSDLATFGTGIVFTADGLTIAGSYGMFGSDGRGNDDVAAVRPVVILKPDITEKQVPKIADKVEEDWNYNLGGE